MTSRPPPDERSLIRGPIARVLVAYVVAFALLFVARFLLQGYLIPKLDQECHIGGIAVDLLANGVRFPLLSYAPNEYDNGSFVNGVLTAGAFAVLGRSYLSLKLVTHAFAALGAVAVLSLLRRAMSEAGIVQRGARIVGVVTIAIALAFAPTLVAVTALFAVGTHTEGVAIDTALFALYAAVPRARSSLMTVALWFSVGLALYVNKGTVLAVATLGLVELALAKRTASLSFEPRRLLASASGFALGIAPELSVLIGRHGLGWMTISEKASRNVHHFPGALIESLFRLADGRATLAAVFLSALGFGLWMAWKTRGFVLRMLAVSSVLHLLAMSVMAQGGFDRYAIYGHPQLVVFLGVLTASAAQSMVSRAGSRGAVLVAVSLVGLVAFAHRPVAIDWNMGRVLDLARDPEGPVCSWRFAEGFEREVRDGFVSTSETPEEHALARCRTLSETAQRLDCVGGIARELSWRRGGHVDGEPPSALSSEEALAYAFDYGVHRRGDVTACGDFRAAELRTACEAAVRLDCLSFSDAFAGMFAARKFAAPHCLLDVPPMDGFWAAFRRDLLSRPPSTLGRPQLPQLEELSACEWVLHECY